MPVHPDENGTLSPEEALAYEAAEVQVLLHKEMVKAAFTATEKQIFDDWQKAENPLAREMCWHELQAFRKVVRKLRALAERHHLHVAKE